MNKIYISSLLIVLMAGAQSIRAQESDLDALMDTSAGTGTVATATAPASVESVKPATVENKTDKAASTKHLQMDLYSRGVQAFKDGKYDQAQSIFEAMLARKPYDTRAMKMLKRTANQIAASAAQRKKAIRASYIGDIKRKWTPDLKGAIAQVSQPQTNKVTAADLAVQKMTDRLKGLIIPTLDFRDANIKDVILFLTETCRRMDPTHKGINFLLLGLNNSDSSGAQEGNNITISIRNMSLYNALQVIVEMASLKFEVQANMVDIMPVNYVRSVDMVEKQFDVITEVGDELATVGGGAKSGSSGAADLFGDSSAAAAAPSGPVDVKSYFSYIKWPDRSVATYYPKFNKLLVKNTPENIKLVKNILGEMTDRKIRERSNQVQIEAKFIEFSQGAYDELGFDYLLNGSGTVGGFGLVNNSSYNSTYATGAKVGTAPSGASIYPDPQAGYYAPVSGSATTPAESLFGAGIRSGTQAFDSATTGLLAQMGGVAPQMLFSNGTIEARIKALEQEGKADLLSSPKVTTQSGNEAVIRVVEIHRYPQDYDVETGQRTAPVVKPQDWEDFDLGVVLRVTPDVDAEKGTIQLQLEPEIRKFKGFEDYAVAVNSYVPSTVVSSYGVGNTLYAHMPYFETRSVSTRVNVADGNTVMMGGLIDERTESYRDQIPILGDIPYVGRLFRTEGSRSVKKNLVIYVTATQVDERGMTRAGRELARNAISGE